MNLHRQHKNKQLTQLASEVQTGAIVELGAYRGIGTLALCQGASQVVYAIDDFAFKKGWAGETYSAVDERIFLYATEGQNVRLIKQEVRQAAKEWAEGPIGLLVWDLGVENRLQEDFDAWQDKVIGKFVIHDTDDQRLGSRELNPVGWDKHKDGVFWILERSFI